jgi:hypothetical protein
LLHLLISTRKQKSRTLTLVSHVHFFMPLACTHTRHYPPRLQPQKHENGSPQQPPSPMPDFRSTANGSWANQQQHFAPTHSVNGAHTSIPSGAVPHSAFSTTNGPSVQPMQQQQFVRHSGSYGASLTAQQAAFDSNTMMRGLTQHNMMATTVGGPWWAPPPPPRARAHTHTHTHTLPWLPPGSTTATITPRVRRL